MYDVEKKRAAAKRYRDKSKEKIQAYYQNVVKHRINKEERNKKEVERRKQNPEARREYEREWYQKNREKILERKRNYSKLPEVLEKTRNRERKKYNEDVIFKLKKQLRNGLYDALKGNKKRVHTMELLGCTIEQLKLHLESQFTEGMTWENYGFGTTNKWSIDHKKPLSWFDLTNEDDLRKAAHYTNLQPMWCSENFSKSNRYEG